MTSTVVGLGRNCMPCGNDDAFTWNKEPTVSKEKNNKLENPILKYPYSKCIRACTFN